MKIEIIDKLADLITTAFGLVAALAWNSAIQALFQKFFGATNGLTAMISYAVIVTVIAVVATIWIGKLKEKAKQL